MTGYQEAVTDPSYSGQIITFTYPLIGNYGVSADAVESDRVHARAVIMREARERLRPPDAGWLAGLARRRRAVPAISGVDTRALVRHIRDRGAMRGGVFPGRRAASDEARELIAAEPAMAGPRPGRAPSRRRADDARAATRPARTWSRSTPASRARSSAT